MALKAVADGVKVGSVEEFQGQVIFVIFPIGVLAVKFWVAGTEGHSYFYGTK